jgi:hypothetical protein
MIQGKQEHNHYVVELLSVLFRASHLMCNKIFNKMQKNR